MTQYRLTHDGWIPHTSDAEGYRKYFADQAKGLSATGFPIKDTVKPDRKPYVKKRKPVKVKLVSTVQDAVDRAKAELKHINGNTQIKNISLSQNIKAATSKKKKPHAVSAVPKHKHTVKRTSTLKHKKAASATRKKPVKDKKSFGSQFVSRAHPRDVWGPAKW